MEMTSMIWRVDCLFLPASMNILSFHFIKKMQCTFIFTQKFKVIKIAFISNIFMRKLRKV